MDRTNSGFADAVRRLGAEVDARPGLSFGWQAAVFVAVLGAIFSRCPAMFLHAQFYAEDGKYWYADAYNLGVLHSLMRPNVGYYSLLERAGAAVSLLSPLRYAPLVMAVIGALVQWLPVGVLLSARCRTWSPLSVRLLMAALYVAIPNAVEIHVVLTNAMWHLALAAALLAFACAPEGWPGRVFDCVVFAFFSLSGPFGILLAPLVLVYWWLRRERWTLAVLGVVSLGSLAQVLSLLLEKGRETHHLGATPQLFVRLVGGNVFEGVLLGAQPFGWYGHLWRHLAVFVFGTAMLLYAMRKAPLPMKLFVVYCMMVLAVSLRSPEIIEVIPVWQELVMIPRMRYFFFPGLALVWASAWCALRAPSRVFRVAGVLVLAVMCVGIRRDWRYAPFADHQFAAHVQAFEAAAPGERVVIPVEPAPWFMELVKRR